MPGRELRPRLQFAVEDRGPDRRGDLDVWLPLIRRVDGLHTQTCYLPRQVLLIVLTICLDESKIDLGYLMIYLGRSAKAACAAV